MIYLVFIYMIIMTWINYLISKNDIMSPVTVAMFALDVGLFFSFMGASSWNFVMSNNTALVIVIGIFVITITHICFSNVKITTPNSWKSEEQITYNYKMIKLVTLLCIIFTLLYGIEAYRVGVRAGGNGINSFAYMKMAYAKGMTGFKMNPIIRQSFKFILAVAYVNIFILIDSLLSKNKLKHNIYILIISILCAMLVVIFSGSRTEILQLLSASVLIYSVRWRESKNWTKMANKKSLFQIIGKIWPFLILLMIIAFGSRAIVKTENNALSASSTFLTYIIYYVGSSFAVLNRKIELSYSNMGLWTGNEYSKELMKSQVYLGDLNYGGNTCTIFSSVFDYGIIGMVIKLLLIFGLSTIVYRSIIINTKNSYKRNRNLIACATMYYIFIMSYYADCSGLITKTNNILILILCLIYYRMIIKHRS